VVKNIFSCFIIGDDNLTLQCAEILLAANHQILGLISPSKHIKKWCITQSIPHIHSIDEFDKLQPFDFLFSIVNGQMLPQNILKRPRYCAINYHNSPLPKYAGLYATTWAILNGETHHAVSWHVMEDIIDAGAILKQSTFPIEETDTALSLNLKCYEHAVESFQKLIDLLATGTVVPIQQDLSVRSYYGLKDKPEHFGFICSKVTVGTTFSVILPMEVGTKSDCKTLKTKKTPRIKKQASLPVTEKSPAVLPAVNPDVDTGLMQILVVEDDFIALKTIKGLVARLPAQVFEAQDAETALPMAQSQLFHLIITDVGLPGKSGDELAKEIREWEIENHKEPTTIVGLTGHAAGGDVAQQCLNAGMNQVYEKPMELDVLKKIIETFVKFPLPPIQSK
jgi:CheY-like chemotaxis protein